MFLNISATTRESGMECTVLKKPTLKFFVRTRLSGRFTLGYSDATAFAAAISAISSAVATNGYTSCQVYANNDGTTHTADCYLTLRGGAKYDFTNDRQWQTVDVELLER